MQNSFGHIAQQQLCQMRKVSRKKGPVTSKVVSYDGITFKSGLEKYMYKALKDAGALSRAQWATARAACRAFSETTNDLMRIKPIATFR